MRRNPPSFKHVKEKEWEEESERPKGQMREWKNTLQTFTNGHTEGEREGEREEAAEERSAYPHLRVFCFWIKFASSLTFEAKSEGLNISFPLLTSSTREEDDGVPYCDAHSSVARVSAVRMSHRCFML